MTATPIDLGRVGLWSPTAAWEGTRDLDELLAELDELTAFGTLWLGTAPGDLTLPERMLAASRRLVVATSIINIWTEPAADVRARYLAIAPDARDRLLIGLGSSHAPLVEPSGVSYRQPLRRLTGYLDELDAQQPTVAPERRVLGVLGDKGLQLATARAAGAHPYLVTPEYTHHARELLGPVPLLAVEQKVVLDTDADRARTIARSRLAQYLTLPSYLNNLRRQGFTDADVTDGGSDLLVDSLVAWGTEQDILDRVAAHHAAGADHVALQVLEAIEYQPANPLPRAGWRRIAAAL
jgi:probable F420-dependent oxidoreductase